MREIKFRAWDNERKIFVPDGSIVFNFYGETYIDVVPNCLEYVGDSCHNGEPQRGRFSISQYTGLIDKNGKEIYEGDIVKWDTYSFDHDRPFGEEKYDVTKVGIIVWRGKGFWVDKEDFGWEGENLWRWDELEVIGNTYENPELKEHSVGMRN